MGIAKENNTLKHVHASHDNAFKAIHVVSYSSLMQCRYSSDFSIFVLKQFAHAKKAARHSDAAGATLQ